MKFVLIFLFTFLDVAEAQVFDQTALESKLFEKYNRKVRPVKSPKDKTEVQFAVHVRHIESVDELQQVLRFHGTVFLSWTDAYLGWNPNDYNATSNINVNSWKVWQPDIALFNSASGVDLVFNSWKYPVWLTNTGIIAEWQDFSFAVTCSFDFYYFPKDRQICTASIGSWMYDLSEIDWKWIESLNVRTKLSWYGDDEKRHSNGWELINATAKKAYWGPAGVYDSIPPEISTKYLWPMMLVRIELQRHRPYFYVTEVLPLVLIGLLTLASFWIESESATLTILLVNLLSQGVLSWGLLGQLPPSSGSLPRIVWIYGFNFGLTCFALFFHIIVQCVSKWKVDLPQYIGNLTTKSNQLKAFQVKGVSLYYAGFDDDDDREQIVEKADEAASVERGGTQLASVSPLTNFIHIIRRAVFFVYFLMYFALIITILT